VKAIRQERVEVDAHPAQRFRMTCLLDVVEQEIPAGDEVSGSTTTRVELVVSLSPSQANVPLRRARSIHDCRTSAGLPKARQSAGKVIILSGNQAVHETRDDSEFLRHPQRSLSELVVLARACR
jgi:hypothetical protein